jgi:hypothetical protein
MRGKSAGIVVVVSVVAGLMSAAGASAEIRDPHTGRGAAKDYDLRATLSGGVAATSAQRQAARALTGVRVTFDSATGGVRGASRSGGALTAKSGASAESIARGFLADNAALFRLSAAKLAGFTVAGQDVLRGVTALTLQQTDAGRDVLGARMVVGIDKDGRILSYDGSYVPDAAADSAAKLSAADAVRVALNKVGESPVGLIAKSSAASASRRTVFQNNLARDIDKPSDVDARLVTFPMPGGRPARLAWKTTTEVNKIGFYESVVDAHSGALLARRNTYETLAGPEGTVFTAQHPGIAGATRSIVSFAGASFDTNGWVGNNRETNGNNVNAYQDKDGDNASDFQPQTPPSPNAGFQDFNYPWTNAWASSLGTDVTTDQAAVVTQMFYYANKYHDYLYGLGFTEAQRNFQQDNFGRGGTGGDPVLAEADDNYLVDYCNANFHTPAGTDGDPGSDPPRMQMFVGKPVASPTPPATTPPGCDNNYVQRAMNGDTIFHEMSHGLSNRMVANGALGGGTQTNAMGEGWGDFFATSYWNDPVYGDYNNGNTTRGIRSVGYGTSTLKYSNLCNGGCEEHSDGEIWATVLWNLRVKLVAKYGDSAARPDITPTPLSAVTGNRRAEQLVVEGMRLSATNPTFVSMRDSILAADNGLYANADECLIWSVFAARELGNGATAGTMSDSQGLGTTSTTAPPQCAVTASAGGAYSTPEGTNVLLSAAASTAGSAASPLKYEWDLDNDGDFDDATGVSPTFSNVGDNASFTVKVKVTGNDGLGFSAISAPTTVTVTNVNPTVNAITTNGSQPEGTAVTASGTITDPGWLDSLTATINWGDGSGTVALPGTTENVQPDATFTYTNATHAYGDNGTYTIHICGTDDDGGSNCRDQNVVITNVRPTVGMIATTSPKNENTSVNVSGVITDPGWLDVLTATINWGEPGGSAVPLTGTPENVAPDATLAYNVNHTYGDDGVFTVTVCAHDDDDPTNVCTTAQVTINNVNPTATIDETGTVNVNGTPVFFAHIGVPVAFKGNSTDPGSDDLTLRWNWDDGGPAIDASTLFLNNPAINPDPDPSPTINPRNVNDTKSHAFGLACAYDVEFSALDDDGGASALDTVKVIITGSSANHDKSAGFWAHEYQSASGDEIDPITLSCYLEITGFLSQVFNEARNASTFPAARSVLNDGPNSARDRLDRDLLTNWLNFANGAWNYTQLMDTNFNGTPDTQFGVAMKNAETVRLNPASTTAQLDAQRKIMESFDN